MTETTLGPRFPVGVSLVKISTISSRNSVNIRKNLLFISGQVYGNKITVNVNVLITIRSLFS